MSVRPHRSVMDRSSHLSLVIVEHFERNLHAVREGFQAQRARVKMGAGKGGAERWELMHEVI